MSKFSEMVLKVLDRATRGEAPPADISADALARAARLKRAHEGQAARAAVGTEDRPAPPVAPTYTRPTPAPTATAPAWTVQSLSALVDAVFGRGVARLVTTRPLERVEDTDAVKRRHAAQNSPDAQAEKVRALKTFLYHAGVRQPQLDYAGIAPRETELERDPRKVAAANRRAAAFLAVLAGATDAPAGDANVVQAAREFLESQTGQSYMLGQKLE